MAVLGRVLIGSQQRVDLTDFLAIDSYSAGDWKYFIKSITSEPLILKGFEVIDAPLSIGTTGISIKVADSVLYHPNSNAGSFFYGLSEGSPLSAPLVPELRANSTNFVYLVLTTQGVAQDSRAFWDVDLNGGAGGEFSQDVNTESVLKVEIGVSVSTFPEGAIPLCKVVMGSTSISSIEDCRNMMFRLGKGGASPDPFNTYAWKSEPSASYARNETPNFINNSSQPTPFAGGDKNISTMKEWMDAIMSKLLEISGTTFWYEGTGGASLPNIFDDALSSTIKSKGKWFHSGTTPGLITWSEDIVYKKINDNREIIIRQNPVTGAQLQNEEVLYIQMERDKQINPSNSPVQWTSGSVFVNGVVGNFEYINKGDWVRKQSDDARLYYRVEEMYTDVNGGGSSGVAGSIAKSIRLSSVYAGVGELAVAQRTKGEFSQTPIEYSIAARDSFALTSAGGNAYWLAMRSDSILNIGSIDTVYFDGTVDISDSDGVKAKLTFPSPHGLIDGDRVVIASAGAYNGIHAVEVSNSNEVYIETTATMNPSGVTVSWAVVTTISRTNGYGFSLESANHGFTTGETVRISDTTTPYDTYSDVGPGLYKLSVRNSTQFQIPYDANTSDVGVVGQATVARIILRTEFGTISVVQGQSIDIGGDIQNLMDFVGMQSMTQTNPLYAIPSDAAGQTLLAGSQNYNSSTTDSLTTRVSRLTGMMQGRVQDRGLSFNGRLTVRNTTFGSDQVLVIDGEQFLSKPGSPNQTIAYGSSYNLAENTALVISLDRDSSSSIVPAIENLGSPFLLAENKLVLYSRFDTTSVYAWNGTEISNSSSHTVGSFEDSQSKNLIMHDKAGIKLDPSTGVFSFNTTLANITLFLPGPSSTQNVINTSAIGPLSPSQRTIPNGSCVWVRVNRRNLKTFTVTTTDPNYQDSDVSGALYITTPDLVPADQDCFVLFINSDGALLAPWKTDPVGNVYEEDKTVVSSLPSNDNEVQGPITVGATISLPLDSRNNDEIQYYIVGSGQLEIYLSGQRLRVNEDWLEVGSVGTASSQIQIQQNLVIGDVLTFRIGTTGAVYFSSVGGGSGGSGSLQDAYNNGNLINVLTGLPVIINGTSGKLLAVNGDVEIVGIIDPKGIEFAKQTSDPLNPLKDGLWVNTSGHLIQKRGVDPSINITNSILNPSSFITTGNGLSWSGSTISVTTDTSGLSFDGGSLTLLKDPNGGIVGDSTTGIRLNIESLSPSLEFNVLNQLRLKRRPNSGINVDTDGVGIELESIEPSMQILSNELGIKIDSTNAIVKNINGIGIKLESTSPSLQIISNELGVKLDANGAISSGTNGLGVNIDSTLSIVGNALSVNAVPFVGVSLLNNSGSLISGFTPISVDLNGDMIPTNVSYESDAFSMVGILKEDTAESSAGVVVTSGKLENIVSSFSFGDSIFVSKTGGLTNTKPDIGVDGFVSGDWIIKVGTITKNQNNPSNKDLIVKVQLVGQL